jgi:hypothetical protein
MTRPCAMSCGTTSLTVSAGTAKPIPALAPDGLAICVFTPMSRPALSRSGPPELPGLIAASVWTTPWILRPVTDSIVLPSALTIPVVSVSSRPNGFPIAKTLWPTFRSRLVPTRIGGSFASGAPILRTARSLSGSVADDGRLPVGLVRERHDERVGVLDDVEVRDDVPLPVPHESRARALRDLGHLEEVHGAPREARDVDDGRAAALEDLDRRLLVRREVAARRDGPGLGGCAFQGARRGPDARAAGPALHEGEDEPAREEPEDDRQKDRAAPPPRRRRRVSIRGRRKARHGAGARRVRAGRGPTR